MRVREVTEAHDAAIAAFGQMQAAAYFAPETLIPAHYIPSMLSGETGSRRNFLVVAEEEDRVIGGALFHYLVEAGSGFSSFLGVASEFRGKGIARALHEERFRILDRAAGAQVPGVFIDVVNPVRMSPEELRRDPDPWGRRAAFEQLGFRQVDIRYEQPVGGPNGGPVTTLDLLYCPHQPSETVATELVVNTMRAYWSPWLGKSAERHARELQRRAGGADLLRLISPVPIRHTYD
jgi:GNAT superfamily N-acetyltransferase